MRRITSLFLLLLCTLLFFVSCGEEKIVHEVDETLFNVINSDGTTSFNIVRKDTTSEQVLDACMALKDAINEKTHVDIEVKTDFEKKGHPEFQRQDYEILVGHTNREETGLAMTELVRNKDFAILQSGTRIAITAKREADTMLAVQYFIDNYIDDEKNTVAMKPGENVVVAYDYPVETMTVNGKDITEYVFKYSNEAYKTHLDALNTFVTDSYGYSINISNSLANDENAILLGRISNNKYFTDVPEAQPLDKVVEISEEPYAIALYTGKLVSESDHVSEFMHNNFVFEDIPKNIEISIAEKAEVVDIPELQIADDAFLASIEAKAEEYKNNVLNSQSEYEVGEGGKVYYVSNDGSDSNSGLSADDAFATINMINLIGLEPGDVVLFRRGDEFRGKIKGHSGVTYSAYGEGSKPIINGSKRDYADPALWVETEYENVYKCTESFENVGFLMFNYSGIIGNYDETIGQLKVGYKPEQLEKDLDFCSNLDTKQLHLYSAEGNPGERFDSIEIADSGNLFQGSEANITVDNLCFMFGGSHGVGSGTVKNRTVRNSIFCWIGGSILKGYNGGNETRYGNAVEVYGGCNGYHVSNNWIYQIYDTGITHQYSKDDKIVRMENIEYANNLVELCHWSIEYYNRGTMPGSCLRNVHVHDNITLHGCYGWGSVGRESGGALHNSFQIIDEVDNYLVENNIFAYSKGNLVRYNEGGDRKLQFRNNTYVQYYDRALGYMFGKVEKFNGDTLYHIKEVLKEENPKIVFIMHDAEKEAEEAAKLAALNTEETDNAE